MGLVLDLFGCAVIGGKEALEAPQLTCGWTNQWSGISLVAADPSRRPAR